MAPVELPQLWPDLIDLLLNLLKPHQLQPDDSALDARPPDAAGGTGSANVNKHALTALSMEKVVEILSQLYRSALIPCCGALRKDIMHQDTTASLDFNEMSIISASIQWPYKQTSMQAVYSQMSLNP
jgi:hypothetical protein